MSGTKGVSPVGSSIPAAPVEHEDTAVGSVIPRPTGTAVRPTPIVDNETTALGTDVRSRRAETFSAQGRASQETETERAARNLARIPGKVTAPAIIAKPADILGQVQNGILTVRCPLKGGTKVGVVKVRNDTTAVVHFAVKDGKIDRSKTEIIFEKPDGSRTDLDGPLWFDGKKVYIDGQGQIKAEVPCFPDPNITKTVLGDKADKIPDNPGAFAELLMARANIPTSAMEIARGGTILGGPGTTPAPAGDAARTGTTTTSTGPGTTSTAPATTTPAPKTSRTPAPKTAAPSAASELSNALNLADLNVTFEGTLKPGPLKFGDGAVFNLAEGATVRCSGPITDLKAEIDAPLKSMQMTADGTRLRSGAGRVRVSVDVDRTQTNSDSALKSVKLDFHELDVSNVDFETPAAKGSHHLAIQHLAVAGKPDEAPILAYNTANGDIPANLALRLPELDLEGVTGELELQGTDGNAAQLKLGDDGTGGPAKPLSFRGRLEIDSGTKRFLFDSHVTEVAAAITPLALVDSAGFDVKLSGGQITGGGNLKVSTEAGHSRLSLTADPGKRWTLQGGIEDAKIGSTLKGSTIAVDVAPETSGRLSLDHLELSGDAPPVFHGDADFNVTLDSFDLALPGTHKVSIAKGTTGTLTISDMGWVKGDRSPTVDATLKLNLGANALLKPGTIPGLEGAKVVVDTQTGDTVLELKATLDREGNIKCAAGLTLKSFEIKTQLERGGMPTLPELNVPDARLTAPTPITLAPVRQPGAPSTGPATTVPANAVIKPPSLPAIQLNPAQIFGALQNCQLNATIPVDAINTRVISLDRTTTKDLWLTTDTMGYRVDVDASRGAGPINVRLAMAGGNLAAGQSRIILSPPLTARVAAQVFLPGPGAPSTHPNLTINALRVQDNGDGTASLRADVDIDSSLVNFADAVIPGDQRQQVNDAVGNGLGDAIATSLFGTSRVPLNGEKLIAALMAKNPGWVPSPTLKPNLGGPELVPSHTPSPTAGVPSHTPAAVVARSPAATPTTAAPPWIHLDGLLGAIHRDQVGFTVKDAQFAAKSIDLGNGQSIELKPGSNLAVTGSAADFTVSGRAALGAVKLGGKDLSAGLGHGEANVKIHVVAGKNGGEPSVTVEITDLNAEGLSASGRIGTGTTRLTNASVKGAKITLTSGAGAERRLTIDLPQVKAELTTAGTGAVAGFVGEAQSLRAQVDGALKFDNGKIEGDLNEIHLKAQGLSFGGTANGRTAGSMTLDGAAHIAFDGKGALSVARRGTQPFTFDADFQTPDGNRYAFSRSTAERVQLATTGRAYVEIENAEGELSLTARLPSPEPGKPAPVLDIRRAHVRGSASLSAEGIRTSGPVAMSNVDASLTTLALNASTASQLDLKQVDFSGAGTLDVSTKGGWAIAGNMETVGDARHSTLVAKGVANRVAFATTSPEVKVVLAPGAQATFELNRLAFGGTDPVTAELGRGSFAGTIDTGSVTTGSRDAMLGAVSLKKGALVSADVNFMKTGPRIGNGPGAAALDVTLRVEGEFGDVAKDLKDGNIELTQLDMAGNIRMIVRALTDGNGNFSARSDTHIDGGARIEGRSQIDPTASWNNMMQPDPAVGTTTPKPGPR